MKILSGDNLPHFAVSAHWVKTHEPELAKDAGICLWELMNRAADALFSHVLQHFKTAHHITVVAGKGNNAGDGFCLAERLSKMGKAVTVVTLYQPSDYQGDAKRAFEQLQNVTLTNALPAHSDLVIDAMLGTGCQGTLKAPIATFCEQIQARDCPILAIDVPTGVDATNACVASHSIIATHTLTFIALKQGLLSGHARHHVGELFFTDLGLNVQAPECASQYLPWQMLQSYIPRRTNAAYKNSAGHCVVIAGDQDYPGAARLCAEAALRVGAGLVTVITAKANRDVVLAGRYELMVKGVDADTEISNTLEKADVVVIGPGLKADDFAKNLITQCHNLTCPVVADAGALAFLGADFKPEVITPHVGEAARILNDSPKTIAEQRFESLTRLQPFADVVVLKGPGTLVKSHLGQSINRSGSEAMASAGMGDVLSGILAGLLAQGAREYRTLDAQTVQTWLHNTVCLGVHLHGLAAEKAAQEGVLGTLPSDLFKPLRQLVQ